MSSSWTPGTCKFTWLSWAPCRKSHQSHLATNPPWRWCAWMELQPGKATGTPLNCRLSVSTRICNWPPWSPVRSFIFLKNQNSLKFELRDDENANGTDRCCRPVNVTGSDWSTRQRSSHRQRHAASSALFTRMTTVAAPGELTGRSICQCWSWRAKGNSLVEDVNEFHSFSSLQMQF